MKAGHRFIGVVLGDQYACLGRKLRVIFLREPVVQIAVGVELAALIVEAMADLMPDDGADATVVHRIVGLHVEERRLQDRGRKHDLILFRVVVRIDSLRRHLPFVAIDRLAELVDIALDLELRSHASHCPRGHPA